MRCAYCKVEKDPRLLVLEHMIPKSRKGSNAAHNRCLACAKCDRAKAARTPKEWKGEDYVFGVPAVDAVPYKPPEYVPPPPHEPKPDRVGASGMVRLKSKPFEEIGYCPQCAAAVKVKGHSPHHPLLDIVRQD